MKAIFFDFDGTLTKHEEYTWRIIWKKCGQGIGENSVYINLYNKFKNKEISYQKWCDLSCDVYKKCGFCKSDLIEISKKIKLMEGIEEFLKSLKEKGYSLHIVSGNIIQVVKYGLGKLRKYFDSINGNSFQFDKNGLIKKIKGTKYDCEGKAQFIEEYKAKTNSRADELYFIGNGANDEWAYLSGCKTICLNPDDTNADDSNKWHIVRENIKNLTEILSDIK